MRNSKSALLVTIATAAVLPLALFSSPSPAAIGVDDQAVSASLYQTLPNDTKVKLDAPFYTGQQIKLYANFGNGVRNVTFYKIVGGTQTTIGVDETNTYGNAYLDYTIVSGDQQIYAEDVNDEETETDSITGVDPPPSSAVLNNPTNSGKTWTAHFTPTNSGQQTKLQMQQIPTTETDEVNPTNPDAKKKDWIGPWKTVATSTQNSSGNSTFTTSSVFRVTHNYRAVTTTPNSPETVSNVLAYGTGNVSPKSTGVSALYFNANENHAIDTRTRYYEGEFSMTASTKAGVNCDAVPTVKNSVMKGRGNYSWSFKRKSFTLKIGSATDLCGMGSSKKYALVSQDYDKSFMRNPLAGYIGSKFTNMAYTPQSKPVDLFVNGSYRGAYLLIERISIDPDRVAIDELKAGDGDKDCNGVKQDVGQRDNPNHANNSDPCVTGGYILEWDFRKGGDYNVNLGSDSGYVGVKDPEFDYDREGNTTSAGISSQQKSYISGYLNSADSAMRKSSCQSNDWKNYIDEASAIDYYLAMEFMKPVDGNMWASVYMYKPRGGKLMFGPLWDFDLAAGSANRAGNVVSSSSWYLRNNLGVSAQQSSNTWFNCLNKRSSFRSAVAARWNQVQGSLNTSGFIDAYKTQISSSANTSYSSGPSSHSYRISKYQTIKGSWDSDVSYLKSWASSRKSWINGQL